MIGCDCDYARWHGSLLLCILLWLLLLTGMPAFSHSVEFQYRQISFKAETEKSDDVTCINCGEHILTRSVQFLSRQEKAAAAVLNKPEEETTLVAPSDPVEPYYYSYTTARQPVCMVCHSKLKSLDQFVRQESERQKATTEERKTAIQRRKDSDTSKKSVAFKASDTDITSESTDASAVEAIAKTEKKSSLDYDICQLSGNLQPIIAQLKIPCDAQGRPVSSFLEQRSDIYANSLAHLSVTCTTCDQTLAFSTAVEQHADNHFIQCDACKRMVVCPRISANQDDALETHKTEGCKNPCRFCQQEIPYSELQTHVISCEKRLENCPKCLDQINGSQLFDHYKTHGVDPITCPECKFDVQANHYATHCYKKCPQTVVCPVCPTQCGSDWVLHLEQTHKNDYQRLCTGYSFERQQEQCVSCFLAARSAGGRALTLEERLPIHETQPSPSSTVSGRVTSDKINLGELDLMVHLLMAATYDGVYIWKIPEVTRRFNEAKKGKTTSLYSAPFYTSQDGYKLCLRAYLDGDGAGKGQFLSFFIVLMKGAYDALQVWPFSGHHIALAVLDQTGHGNHIIREFMTHADSTSFHQPKEDFNIAAGIPKMAHQKVVFGSDKSPKATPYLKDDTLFLECRISQTNIKLPGM